ncbi:MAG: sulfotransferase [Methylovulum sp.]|nr:sulfotransferase [Methylovulum sp.]
MIEKLLIGAGAMKAGTTWLYKQLETHPDISFTPEKEIHYFSYINGMGNKLSEKERTRKYNRAIERNSRPKIVKWYKNYAKPPSLDDDWYCSLFADVPEQAYCADFSNQYALLAEKDLEQILKVAKDVKIIYTLRDPLARLWSHVKFQYKFVGEEHGVDDISVSDFRKIISKPWFWDNAEYLANYRRLANVFGESQVKLLYLEDFVAFPQGSLWGVEKFLDIAHVEFLPEAANNKVNKTKEMAMPKVWERIAKRRLRPIYDELYAHGLNHPSWRW